MEPVRGVDRGRGCGFALGARWLACALTPFGCAPRPEGSLTLASTRPLALSAEILATGVHGASCVPAGLFDPPRVAPVFFDLSGDFSLLSTRALSLPIERRSEVMVEVCAAYDKGMQKTVETAIAKTSDANAVMNASVEVSPLGCHRVKGIAVRLPSP